MTINDNQIMRLEIITPETTLFAGDVSLVQLPGIDGSFEILDNHAPLISVLSTGKVKIQDAAKQTQFFDIKGGVVEVLFNKVLVLAE
jgi:F-type H+-transporting ATPase subunit epsilon